MSPVAAPADRRFRRAHVKPARKRRRWQALGKPFAGYAIIALVAAYGFYRGSYVVAHARVLPIDRIVVGGNDRLSTGEVLGVLNGLRGESLVWTDLDLWRKRLLASPWVRDAVLRRSLPATIDVLVWERQPIGLARLDGDMYLVDDQGMLIDQYGPQYADVDLPIVDGLEAAPKGGGGSMTDETRAALAARVINALSAKPQIARRLSQIDVSDLHNVTLILTGDSAVLQLGDDQFLRRLESYLDLATALRDRVPDVDYVDLRFEDRIYVRPATKPVREGPANRPRKGYGGPPKLHAEAEEGPRKSGK